MSLDRLKITECPYAFASFAEKHNALVDMLAAMQGQNGITVVMAEKNAIIRGNIANANGGGSVSLSNVANVVGYDGRLQNVYVGNTIANAYPTTLKTVNPAGNTTIDNVGLVTHYAKVATAAGNVTIDSTMMNVSMPGRFVTASGNVDISSTGVVITTTGGVFCNIAFASLTHNMNVRTITVCDNGSTKSMDIIASATY